MILVPMAPYDGTVLSRKGDALLGEASDLRFRECSRIYDDACDIGIFVRGHSQVVGFALQSAVRNEGGDEILYWDFHVIPEHEKRANGIKTLRLFND